VPVPAFGPAHMACTRFGMAGARAALSSAGPLAGRSDFTVDPVGRPRSQEPIRPCSFPAMTVHSVSDHTPLACPACGQQMRAVTIPISSARVHRQILECGGCRHQSRHDLPPGTIPGPFRHRSPVRRSESDVSRDAPDFPAVTPWQPIATAPPGHEIEVAVLDRAGYHVFAFWVRCTEAGWAIGDIGGIVPIDPTHWRERIDSD